MSALSYTPPKMVKFRGAHYRLDAGSSSTVRTGAPRYWQGSEEQLQHYMGVGDADDPPELPQDIKVPNIIEPRVRKHYYDVLRELVHEPDSFLWAVKHAVRDTLLSLFDKYLVRDPAPRDHDNIEWLGDEFAHEELFSAMGGSPEYNFFLDPPWKQLTESLKNGPDGQNFDVDALERRLVELSQNVAAAVWLPISEKIEEANQQARQATIEYVSENFAEPAQFLQHYLDHVVRNIEHPQHLTIGDLFKAIQEDPEAVQAYETIEEEFGDGVLKQLGHEFLVNADPRQTNLMLSSTHK